MFIFNKDNIENWNINTDNLNINSEEDIKYILRILFVVIKSQIMDVIFKKVTKEKAKENLVKQIEILKFGMVKKQTKKYKNRKFFQKIYTFFKCYDIISI